MYKITTMETYTKLEIQEMLYRPVALEPELRRRVSEKAIKKRSDLSLMSEFKRTTGIPISKLSHDRFILNCSLN